MAEYLLPSERRESTETTIMAIKKALLKSCGGQT